MPTRHRTDTSAWFDRRLQLPDAKQIEVADIYPIPEADPPMALVTREPYLANRELEEAINVAITMGRPLLLQGDPGSGKTRLAHAVAFALGLPLELAYIKSTSRAQDLLYVYDAIRRLYDAQLQQVDSSQSRVRDVGDYIHLGPLGRAIARAAKGRRSVVLIDEIDKADIDFPNDLLHELDQLSFQVSEAPALRFAVPEDRPDLRPIIFITNNEEKALPDAFLRRCIFYDVKFPEDPEHLEQILALHDVGNVELRTEAIDVLLRLRKIDLAKKPGLSELLDWVGFLDAINAPLDEIESLPYLGAVLKQRGDQLRAIERFAGT
jgi:MoxR-like ATPase